MYDKGYRTLSQRTPLRRSKERYVGGLAEDVEGCLDTNDLRPALSFSRATQSLC